MIRFLIGRDKNDYQINLIMKNALIIVDLQKYFINEFTKKVPDKIKDFLKNHNFDFVLFTKFINKENSSFVKILGWNKMFSSPETDIVPAFQRLINKENIFEKSTFSIFKSKKFLKFLIENKINRIFICGFDTDACILSSVFDGLDLGFDVKVIEDLCASHHGKKFHDYAIKILKRNSQKIVIQSSDIIT